MTLVELMASMMVASIIMVALMQALSTASVSWTQQSKNFSAQREGRVAMRILADDVAAMVAVPQWAREAASAAGGIIPQNNGLTDPTDIRTGFELMAAKGPLDSGRLAFLRATDSDTKRGDLQIVMYGVALSGDGSASGVAPDAASQKLVRRVLSEEVTFRRVTQHLQSGLPLVTESDWRDLEEMRHEEGVAEVGVIAHDLIRFELTPFEDLQIPATPQAPAPWRPTNWIDVTVRVTNRSTGQYLRTEADWKGTGEREALLLNGTRDIYDDDPEVRTYTMRLRTTARL